LSAPNSANILLVRFQDEERLAELFWNERAKVYAGDKLLILYRVRTAPIEETTRENSILVVVVSMDSYDSLPAQAR
jgi:hypothetical protein